jgi:hypothetical protein
MLAINWLQIRQPEKNIAKRKKYKKNERASKNVQMHGRTQKFRKHLKESQISHSKHEKGTLSKILS